MSMPVSTENEIFNICKISSNYDTKIAKIIAQTMTSVGLDGVVNIVESPIGETRFSLVNGLVFERGFVSNSFVTEFKIEQK
jgi:chaperonin GroEL